MSASWQCVDDERHVYACVLGSDVVRVEFDGRPDPCCLDIAYTAARLVQLEAAGHRIREISIGTPGTFDVARIGAADQLASARHDITVRVEATS